MVAIVWFRRDLRLHDHPALRAALERHERVVPTFCVDDRLLHGVGASGGRTAFMLECLEDLAGRLADRGGRLVVVHGPPETELPALARALGATELHCTADVSPYARGRDRRVREALAQAGVTVHAHPGLAVVDDVAAVRTAQGRPYTVFTPFFRRWEQVPRRAPLAAPERVRVPGGLPDSAVPTLSTLGLRDEVRGGDRGGENEAIARLDAFLTYPVREYAANRERLAPAGSSRLSAYFRFGCLSPRVAETHLPDGDGAAAFRRQLCWRDFYLHVLVHHPGSTRQEFQRRYRGTLAWNDDEHAYTAWTQGRTGFPLVDAGMRQLRREGWMPGRARLVVGSFLTKDLGIDWRAGEAWFMRWLLDGDLAANNGNWQWVASVGTDPAPPYRRLYNPGLHRDRYDPDGRYVRANLPELSRVPDSYLSEPWRMPPEEQHRARCRIGHDYPAPLVDHRAARVVALDRYRVGGRT